MIGEITVVPQAEGPAREAVRRAVAEIARQGVHYQVGPMGTSVEGSLEAVRAVESRLRAAGVHRAMLELRLQLEPHEETLEHQVEGIGAG